MLRSIQLCRVRELQASNQFTRVKNAMIRSKYTRNLHRLKSVHLPLVRTPFQGLEDLELQGKIIRICTNVAQCRNEESATQP